MAEIEELKAQLAEKEDQLSICADIHDELEDQLAEAEAQAQAIIGSISGADENAALKALGLVYRHTLEGTHSIGVVEVRTAVDALLGAYGQINELRQQRAEAQADTRRLDWLDSINPIGCWDGWIELGEHSHSVSVWIKGEWNKSRAAIDAAMEESKDG